MKKILAVDDEAKNLKLIEAYLEDENDFDIELAENGLVAWKKVLATGDNKTFDLILLDRMMPEMDGMEFMRKLKSNPKYSHIPVIMQTAAAEKSQVVEGIKAGVYHYLTKPYDEETLLSIVKTCLEDNEKQSNLQNEVRIKRQMVGLIKSCHIEYKSVNEAKDVATYIATLFPEPDKVVMGISELLINGVEHGNLGITYDEKTDLNKNENWSEKVDELLNLPENKDKVVSVDYKFENNEITLYIKDEGKGFDWEKYMVLSPDRATDNHGRGIVMANTISFDRLQYIGKGNEVICTVFLDK